MPTCAKLHELLRLASQAGLDPEVVNAARREAIQLLLLADRRKEQTAALARRIRAADERLRRAGIETGRVGMLCEQFGFSRQYVHTLLRVSSVTDDRSVIPSWP
jgi:hypothetical protein